MPKIILIILTSILFVLSIIGIFFVIRFVYRSNMYKKPSKIIKFISSILSKYGYIHTNEIYLSFKKASELLKKLLGKENYLYELPWFMICGTENSGKKSIIDSLNINRPIGIQNFNYLTDPITNYYFFDTAILLKVKNAVFLGEDNYNWNLLNDILHNKRKNRPIDGIVLVISMEEILGDIDDVSKMMRSRLWQAQVRLDTKFPVYVIINKSDKLSGFTELCNNLSDEEKNEIFGWSNPYQVNEMYSSNWIEEGIKEFDEKLRRIINKILAVKDLQNSSKLSLLPKEFEKITINLKSFINTLFHSNKYSKSFIFRGVYFTGKEDLNISIFKKETNFVNDLFQEKIFKESNIAPIEKFSFFAKSRNEKAIQALIMTVLILLNFKLFTEVNRIHYENIKINKTLNDLEKTLIKNQNNLKKIINDPEVCKSFIHQIMKIIEFIDDSTNFSYFIPFSWIGSLNSSINELSRALYCYYIFFAIRYKSITNLDQLVNISETNFNKENNFDKDIVTLKNLREFLDLKDFVSNIILVEKVIYLYNNAQTNKRIEDFEFIMKALFDYQIDENSSRKFYKSYSKHLSNLILDKINLDNYKYFAKNKFNLLMDNFVMASFDPEKIIPILGKLKNEIEDLEKTSKYDIDPKNFDKILRLMTNLINYLNDPKSKWIKSKELLVDHEILDIMESASQTNLISDIDSNITNQMLTKKFRYFRKFLLMYNTETTGNFFELNENDEVVISKNFMIIYGGLNLISSQSFVDTEIEKKDIFDINSNNFVIFLQEGLEQITNTIKNYDKSLKTIVQNFPIKSHNYIEFLVYSLANRFITNKISESIQINEKNSIIINCIKSETLKNLVSNLDENLDNLKYIIQYCKKFLSFNFYEKFTKILINQCELILTLTEEIIQEAGIYYPTNIRAIEESSNIANEIFTAYNVSNQQELIEHFKSERNRLLNIVDSYTRSAIKILTTISSVEPSYHSKKYQMWISFIKDIENYMSDTKSNSLHEIETFILVDLIQEKLNKATYEKYKKYKNHEILKNVFKILSEQILKKKTEKNREKFYEMYYEIASYFNKKISGRFPFCNFNKNTQTKELSCEEFQKFIALLNKYKEVFEVINKDEDIETTSEMKFFIKKLQKIYNVFKLDKNGFVYVNGKVAFNSNKRTEKNTKYISNIQLAFINKSNQNKHINIYDENKDFYWYQDNNILINVKLSKDSCFRFKISNNLSQNTLKEMEFKGPWSLIKMILLNQRNNCIKIELPIINIKNKKFDTLIFEIKIDLDENISEIFPTTAPNYEEDIDIDIDQILSS